MSKGRCFKNFKSPFFYNHLTWRDKNLCSDAWPGPTPYQKLKIHF